MSDQASVDVKAELERRVMTDGVQTFIGQFKDISARLIAESECAGTGDRAGHVGDAIMYDAFNFIRRVAMGGRMRRFHAAALIDRDIDNDRTFAHT